MSRDEQPAPGPAPIARPRPRDRRRPSPEARSARRRYLTYSLCLVSLVLVVNAVVGENGYLAQVQARRQAAVLLERIAAIEAETATLKHAGDRILTTPEALEEAVRRELGWIRSGEELVIVRDEAPLPPAPAVR